MASVTRRQSSFSNLPDINFLPFIWPTELIILDTSCSAGISNENMAIFFLVLLAAFIAIFKARALLPTAGLAAIIISWLGWKPDVRLSKSHKPDVIPVMLPLFLANVSKSPWAFDKTSWMLLNSLVLLFLDTFKIFFSALSNKSYTLILSL